MQYSELLAGTQSKTKVLNAVAYIGDNPTKFKHFVTEFMHADSRESQKLSWIIGKIVDTQPTLLKPHISSFILKLKKPCHAAVKRNVLRALSFISIPEDQIGVLADLAFKLLDDPKETVAVRVFAMSILHGICLLVPELSHELISILEYHMPHNSPGFKSRSSKVIRSLSSK